ncbi:hypothetical protein QP519_11530 [Weeksella virosa]|uniref:hypothetical protein n=1 Tax=Weeksella virosa TaxID=1014 RepID=UPI0025545221|nr:hypothetical protein [Weeksella virosa]MDK7376158.1 hypothetical protein [Weeksella virosa]
MKKGIIAFLMTGLLMMSCGVDDPQAIKGLEHSDLYLNLKSKGFTDEAVIDEQGVSHVSIKELFGANYRVSSNGTSQYLYGYTASVVSDFDLKGNVDARQFFEFLSSLPYDNSSPEVIRQWVSENYNKKESDTVVGGVRFFFTAPSDYARQLVVEKAN